MNWHALQSEEVIKQLNTDLHHGLTDYQASELLKAGRNELVAKKGINPFKLFLSQFKDALIIVLLIAATISLGLSIYEQNGEYKESLLIYAIVIVIALIGFFNEYKAEKTISALKKLVGHTARVLRNSKQKNVDSVSVVPGDIVYLEAGQKVPADIRLIVAKELHINEASLTGESEAVTKHEQPQKPEAILADRKCMAYSGTFVTNGTGIGVVVATGQHTEIGAIADLVDGVETESTPMQQKLDDLGKKLGYIIAAICAVVFFVVLFLVPSEDSAGNVEKMIFAFTAAVALAVAAIPEGLAFVVRISLALGSRRMAAKNALVRKLSAVEALGSTDVICSDKTGTLTKGEMTVTNIYVNSRTVYVGGSGYETTGTFSEKPKSLEMILKTAVLCNDARLKKGGVVGDPTEGALLVSATKLDINSKNITETHERIDEIPFSSDRKMMSTYHRNIKENSFIVSAKGATEVILAKCAYFIDASGKTQELDGKTKTEILNQAHHFSKQALRVLAFAYKTHPEKHTNKNDYESKLIFIGLQAMIDPPRKEVVDVIGKVQQNAGIRVVMITGDHIETAKAIASEIGIQGVAVSGQDLDTMNDTDLKNKINDIGVYARVSPGHKMRIVQAFKNSGKQVAMTGDGVNDAPALKAADIGIAMGKSGSDVAKEAADLILLDDQFLTIIKAIEEGRGIFENVRKFVNFLISCNIAEVLTILAGILIYQNLLLTAAQLLFINIVTDGLPAIALGSDPARKNILNHKPSEFQGSIITRKLWIEIFAFGLIMSIMLSTQYAVLNQHGHIVAVSTLFTAMVVYELMHLLDIRAQYKLGWFTNKWLLISIGASFSLQLIVLYVPAVARYFEVVPIGIKQWFVIIVGGILLSVFMRLFAKYQKQGNLLAA
ncbi:MAG: cation-translocating P-type ATPase [Patescibacteria group bacterium]|nr:cation-translocating P-type ATPase [Patescibacteria group bacterium]